MNFYEYHQPGESLDESAVYLAACDLVRNGFQVIPIKKGTKEPESIKSVYEIIAKPIHEKNIDYFFKNREVDLGIIMDHNMEFIDIDPKNKPGVELQVLRALSSGWPELYDKLVIDQTPSGGLHLVYRSEVVGGRPVLAKAKATPNPRAIIERISRSNKQYIKISPSDGYKLLQKNPFDIPFLTAEERNFISAVCASFDEVPKPEVKKKESQRPDSPWSVFNSSHDWEYTVSELADRNWVIYRDDTEKIYVRRPGDTRQQYSGVVFKGSGLLYLFTPSTEFENEKAYSPFGVYCLLYHDNDPAAACRQLSSEGCGVNIFNEGQFWTRNKSKLEIKYTELLSWLTLIGYRMYQNTLVQVVNNIVTISDEKDMKRAFLNEVEYNIRDEMYERIPTIFKDKGGLMAMLPELDDNFIRDDEENTWLFFKNSAVRVSQFGPELIDYKTLDGYIWKSEIIDREFYSSNFKGCDADEFVSILGGERKRQLMEIIGYSISKYKDPLNPRAVVLMEDIDSESEGESQGGSGKGLCFQFIKQFRKSTDFDGKNFKFSDNFLYQNVEKDTSIIFIDDVEKNFPFSKLFSILTGPLLINAKNMKQVILPYDRSPKVFITSNYSIGSIDTSSKRRKYEFPVVKHFGETLQPIDHFGHTFFSGWDRAEWLQFDNFIAECCRLYLSDDDKRSISTTTVNSAERALINNTHREFVDYMDRQLASNFFDFCPIQFKNLTRLNEDGSLTTNAVNMEMWLPVSDQPENYFVASKHWLLELTIKQTGVRYLTTTKVSQWLKRWAEFRGVEIQVNYQRLSNDEKRYRIVSWNDHFKSSNQ